MFWLSYPNAFVGYPASKNSGFPIDALGNDMQRYVNLFCETLLKRDFL